MIDEKSLLEEFEKIIAIRETVYGEEKEDISFSPVGISNIVSNQPKIGEWIPCSEQLPEEYKEVLVWYEYFRYGDYNKMFQTYGIGYQADGF